MQLFHPLRLSVLLGLILAMATSGVAQEAKLSALISRSPAAPNAISYVHAPSLKKLLAEADITMELSEKVQELWMVSDLNIDTLAPNWEAGYADVGATMDADTLAKSLGGYVDIVGDKKAVWTPNESYLLPMDDKGLGFLRPAKRSLLAEWVNSTGDHPIPDYLATQAKQPEQYLSMMLAIDLKNSLSPVLLQKRAADLPSLAGKDIASLAKLLASAQGLSLIVGRNSLNQCILSLEFSESPQALVAIAPALLNDILNRNGTSAPEVSSWKAKADGNRLALQGPIAADTLDAVLGIFSLRDHAERVADSVSASKTAGDAPPSEPSQSQVVVASKEYFGKVEAYIDRVRRYEAQTTGYRAKWDEQQARRIDELPTLNVDPQLVNYGADVANVLRSNSTAIRSGNVAAGQVQASQAQNYGYSFYTDGYYGGFYGNSRGAALNNAMTTGAQQRMAGFGSYREAIAAIDKMTGEVRRGLTEKYQVQF